MVKEDKGIVSRIIEFIRKAVRTIKDKIGILTEYFTKGNNNLPNKEKDNMPRLAWTLSPAVIPCVVNAYSLTMSLNTPDNASASIKKSNKLLAMMYLNKILAKIGASGDKTILSKKMDDETAAYFTHTQSYNATDAIIVANNLAAKTNRKNRLVNVAISSVVSSVYCLVTGSVVASLFIMILLLIVYLIPVFEPEWLILINMCMTPVNISMFVVNGIMGVIEFVIRPPGRTAMVRSAIYLIAQLLTI